MTTAAQETAKNMARTIRGLLALKGLNQQDLLDVMPLGYASIQKRMAGLRPWKANELMAIADLIGVPVGALFADPDTVLAGIDSRKTSLSSEDEDAFVSRLRSDLHDGYGDRVPVRWSA